MRRERNRWLTAYAVAIYAFLFAPIVDPDHLLVQRLAAELRLAAASRSTGTRGCSPTTTCSTRCRSRSQVALVAVIVVDGPGHAAGPGAGAAAVPRPRRRPRRCSCCRWSRPRSSWASACCCSSCSCSTAHGSIGQIVDRPHHVLHLVRGGRRPGARREHGPAAGGGRARPRGVGVGRVPVRDAAADRCRRSPPGRCSRSRCRSTTASSRRSTPGVGSSTLPLYIYSADQVRRDARDQRDLDDHRGGHRDPDLHRLAAGRAARRPAERRRRRSERRRSAGSAGGGALAAAARRRSCGARWRRSWSAWAAARRSARGRRAGSRRRPRRTGRRPSGRTPAPTPPGSSSGRRPSCATRSRAAGARTRASPGGW